MAWELYRYGRIPYLGSWDNNFPGIIYIHYLGIGLFGKEQIGLRAVDLLLQILFGFALFHLWRRWLSDRVALLAITIYYLYYLAGGFKLYSERDVFGALFLLASIAIALEGEGARRQVFWAIGGLFAGYATLIRPTYPVLALMLAVLLYRSDAHGIRRYSGPAIYLLCSTIPCAIVVAYYASILGGLDAIYIATIRFNRDLYLFVTELPLKFLLEFMRCFGLIALAAIALLPNVRARSTQFVRRPLQRRDAVLYASLLIVSLAFVIVQRKFLRYQFATFAILLTPLAAVGVEHLAQTMRQKGRQYAVRIIVPILCTLYCYGTPTVRIALARAIAGEYRAAPILDPKNAERRPHWQSEDSARDYIARTTGANDVVEIASYEPYLREAIDREPAGQFASLSPLALRLDPHDPLDPMRIPQYQLGLQRKYVRALDSLRPQLIVIARHTLYWSLRDPYISCLQYLPGFDSLLRSSYQYDTSFYGFQCFRRRT